jgi:hypothetical protein
MANTVPPLAAMMTINMLARAENPLDPLDLPVRVSPTFPTQEGKDPHVPLTTDDRPYGN